MRKRNARLAAAAGAVTVSLVLGACGGDSDGAPATGDTGGADGFDAATTRVVNPSQAKGGTLTFGLRGDFDSTDPGDAYYAFSNNFSRLYARRLLTYASKPGVDGTRPAPDLATGLGTPGDGNRTWTYTLRQGIKYEDGKTVTAQDIKYAVARTFDRDVLHNGPSYFKNLLAADGYKGPFKDHDLAHFTGVQTPDDHTVVFKLKEPFSEFDELLMFSGQTAPVRQAADKGADYRLHPLSTGPYQWDGAYQPGKGGALVRNPRWDPATDPNRQQLPDRIKVIAGIDGKQIDDQLLSGTIDVAMTGNGLNETAVDKVLADPRLKANTDNPVTGFHEYIPIDTKVIPNVDCRKAIIYGVDRDAMWQAFGGDRGGAMATSIMPPAIPGRQPIDELYPAKPGYHGDPAKAKQELAKCGKPNGFATVMTYHGGDAEKNAAEAMQRSLAKVGIKLTLKTFEDGTYAFDQLGSPAFMAKNHIGLGTNGWAADWPTGYGFLEPMVDGAAIQQSGNINVSQVNDPQINDLWRKVTGIEDPAEREKVYNQIDRRALDLAVLIPNIYVKSMLYRSDKLTNVYFHQGFGMYDYANLGVAQ